MRHATIASIVIIALAGSIPTQGVVAAPAYTAITPSIAEVQRIQQEGSALLEAHLAEMKTGLSLTEAQAIYWPAFETAIREAAKARNARWLEARKRMSVGERPSPIDRISIMADHIEKTAGELREVVDAGKPLYDSLSDAQKSEFGPLMREFKARKQL